MNELVTTITQIGKQKAFDAHQHQFKIKIKWIGVGDRAYTPNENQTALQNEIERVEILSSEVNATENTITMHAILQSEREYWINEVGFYLDDGTLFAVWSHPTLRIGYKSKLNKFLLGFRLKIVNVPISVVQIIDQGVDLRLFYSEEFVKLADAFTSYGIALIDIEERLRKEAKERKDRDRALENALALESSIRKTDHYMLLEAIIQNTATIAQLGDALISLRFDTL